MGALRVTGDLNGRNADERLHVVVSPSSLVEVSQQYSRIKIASSPRNMQTPSRNAVKNGSKRRNAVEFWRAMAACRTPELRCDGSTQLFSTNDAFLMRERVQVGDPRRSTLVTKAGGCLCTVESHRWGVSRYRKLGSQRRTGVRASPLNRAHRCG